MKSMERIVLSHLRTLASSTLDLLQFAYLPGLDGDDGIIYLLHQAQAHMEFPQEHHPAITVVGEDGGGQRGPTPGCLGRQVPL